MADGFEVSPAALKGIAGGINKVVGQLNNIDPGSGSIGWGFRYVGGLSSLDVGGNGITDALGNFASRWETGTENLVSDAGSFANQLGISSDAYEGVEHEVASSTHSILQSTHLTGAAKVVAEGAVGAGILAKKGALATVHGAEGAYNATAHAAEGAYNATVHTAEGAYNATAHTAEGAYNATAHAVEGAAHDISKDAHDIKNNGI